MRVKTDAEYDVLSMGEVMLRLSPPGKERISTGESFEKHAGGSELNVAAGVSLLGLRGGIITKIPDNEIGKFINRKIRYSQTSDDFVIFDSTRDKRLGIYYSEHGAYPRLPTVVYDRYTSSFNSLSIDEINPSAYKSCKVFHVSGITLALSQNNRDVAIEAIRRFKKNGTLISFDVNFRANLWSEEEARSVIEDILPLIDIFFASEETFSRMLERKGTLQQIHKDFAEQFPNLKYIISTHRKVASAVRHSFGSLCYECENKLHFSEETYEDIEVVDRIGSGDAFVAGMLFGLLKYNNAQQAVSYGNAMAALKNTIPGDMPACDIKDVENVIKNHKNKDRKNEMNR